MPAGTASEMLKGGSVVTPELSRGWQEQGERGQLRLGSYE